MDPASILKGIKSYFQPTIRSISGTLDQYMPSKTNNMRMDASPIPQKLVLPRPSGSAQPQRATPSAQDFQKGFSNFGGNVPVATISGEFAKGAQQTPSNIDPYIAAVLSLMETGGGAKTVQPNNAWNLSGIQNGNSGFVAYPDLKTALMGGKNGDVQSSGFIGTLLRGTPYDAFRKSGKMEDFFNVYTPPGAEHGNPSMEQLMTRYDKIRKLFPN